MADETTDRGYVFPSSDEESARLERQAELYGGTDFLRPFLADAPREVLEVGCGTGAFARHAAQQLATSRIVGLDLDGRRISYARAHANAPNLEFARGDLLALPFEDRRFDLVFCRFVLVHVADPTAALAEMARVTRAGGRIVAYDMIHDGIWFSPQRPAFTELLRNALAVMRSRGFEPNQGLHLAPAMIRAGLERVEVEIRPHAMLAADPRFETYRRTWLETIASLSSLLGERFDPGLVERARTELEERRADDLLVETTVLAHGTRPERPPSPTAT